MTIGLLFWILMVITLIFGVWSFRDQPAGPAWGFPGLTWILFFLLGWRVFGFPIQG